MKKSLIIFTLLFLTISINGQDKKYFDSPFGGGGGYVPGWFFANIDPINLEFNQVNMPKLSTSGFYTSGGAGFIYIGFVPGLRVGGMGYGGGTSESVSLNNLNRESKYSIGGGALSIEYTLPFIKNIGVSIGGLIGAGSLQIEIYQNKGNYTWDEIWVGDPPSPNNPSDISYSFSNDFFFFTPTLNIDIPIYRFLNFRIGTGYQLSFADDWTIENDKEISGVSSDINGSGFFIQSGIFIGFFSF